MAYSGNTGGRALNRFLANQGLIKTLDSTQANIGQVDAGTINAAEASIVDGTFVDLSGVNLNVTNEIVGETIVTTTINSTNLNSANIDVTDGTITTLTTTSGYLTNADVTNLHATNATLLTSDIGTATGSSLVINGNIEFTGSISGNIEEVTISNVEARIAANEGDIVILNATVADLSDRVLVNEGDITDISQRLFDSQAQDDTDVLDLSDRVLVNEGNITDISQRLFSSQAKDDTDMLDLSGRVEIVETLATDISNQYLKLNGGTMTGSLEIEPALYAATSSGNVGIGTNTTAYKLDVLDSTATGTNSRFISNAQSALRVSSTNGQPEGNDFWNDGDMLGEIQFGAEGQLGGFRQYPASIVGIANGNYYTTAGPPGLNHGIKGSLEFKVASHSTGIANDSAVRETKMKITHDGKVGINTTTPSQTLDVSGTTKSKHITTDTQTVGRTDISNSFNIFEVDGNARVYGELRVDGSLNIGPATVTFFDDGDGVLRMQHSSGTGMVFDLGEGKQPTIRPVRTTRTDAKVLIDNTAEESTNPQLDLGTDGAVGIGISDPSGSLHVSGDVYVEHGNVGIGTNDPQSTLDVSGETTLGGNLDVEGDVMIKKSGANNVTSLHIHSGNNHNYPYIGTASQLILSTRTPEFAGDNYPDFMIQVGQPTANDTHRSSTKFIAGHTSYVVDNTTSETVLMEFDSKYDPNTNIDPSYYIKFNEPSYFLDKVGIGTNDPTEKLHVAGDMILDNGATTTLTVYGNDGNGSGANQNNIVIKAGADNSHFNNLMENYIEYQWYPSNTDASIDPNWFRTGIHRGDNKDIHRFSIANETQGDIFNIKADGNVGIGTTSPTYKLDVGGDTRLQSSLDVGGDVIFQSSFNVKSTLTMVEFKNKNSHGALSLSGYQDILQDGLYLTESNIQYTFISSNHDYRGNVTLGSSNIHSYYYKVYYGYFIADLSGIHTFYIGSVNNPTGFADDGAVVFIEDQPFIWRGVLSVYPNNNDTITLVKNQIIKFQTILFDFTGNEDVGIWLKRPGETNATLLDHTSFSTSKFVVNGTNVGIGTDSPSYNLDVSGTLRATGSMDLDSTLDINSIDNTNLLTLRNGNYSTGNTAIENYNNITYKHSQIRFGDYKYSGHDVSDYYHYVSTTHHGGYPEFNSIRFNVAGRYINRSSGTDIDHALEETPPQLIIRGNDHIDVKSSMVIDSPWPDSTNNKTYLLDVTGQTRLQGATTLGSTLDVTGITNIDNTTDADLNNNAALVVAGGASVKKAMRIGYVKDSQNGVLIGHPYGSTYANYGYIQGVTSGNATSKLNINPAGGNVGIGVTEASEKLHVNGNIILNDTDKLIFKSIPSTSNSTGATIHYNDYNRIFNIESKRHIQFRTYAADSDTIPSTRLFIKDNGNVGIGTTSPSYKLDVNGTLNASGATTLGSTLDVTGVTNINNTTQSTSSTTGALVVDGGVGVVKDVYINGAINLNNSLKLFNSGGFDVIRQNSDLVFRRSDNSTTQIYIQNNTGNVGIGTSSASVYKLHVKGSSSAYILNQRSNLNGSSITTGINSPLTTNIAAKIEGGLWSSGDLHVNSDRRIKKDIKELDDREALDTFRKISPCKYKYIDYLDKGSQEVYGFISQQIHSVFPHAVDIHNQIIPDYYDIVTNITRDKECILFDISENYELDISDKIKISYVTISGEVYSTETIVNDISHNTISVNIDNTHDISNIFLYGKEINDFHTLNKSAIWTVATAALQEVDRTLERVRKQNHIIRGKCTLGNSTGVAILPLEETEFTNPQVFLQNNEGWSQVKGSLSGNILTINAKDEGCTDTIDYMITVDLLE